MSGLLPSRPDTSGADEKAPRVIGLGDEDADDALSALSSGTARRALSHLHDDPTNAAALADELDTSLQNVQYHLGRLESAGLVEVVDTVYSEKGREMKVYAPSDRPLVVFAGRSEERVGFKQALTRLLGGVGVLAILSVVVQRLVGSPTVSSASMDAAEAASRVGPSPSAGLPPGVLFFLGGLSVLLVGVAVWYVSRRD